MLSNVAMEHSAYKHSFFSGAGMLFTSVIAIAMSYIGELGEVAVISLSEANMASTSTC